MPDIKIGEKLEVRVSRVIAPVLKFPRGGTVAVNLSDELRNMPFESFAKKLSNLNLSAMASSILSKSPYPWPQLRSSELMSADLSMPIPQGTGAVERFLREHFKREVIVGYCGFDRVFSIMIENVPKMNFDERTWRTMSKQELINSIHRMTNLTPAEEAKIPKSISSMVDDVVVSSDYFTMDQLVVGSGALNELLKGRLEATTVNTREVDSHVFISAHWGLSNFKKIKVIQKSKWNKMTTDEVIKAVTDADSIDMNKDENKHLRVDQ